MNKNKRRHPRVTAVNFISVMEVTHEQLQEHGQLGATVNISKSGVLFESRYPFPLLSVVRLSMTLKDNVVEFKGRVVRLEEIAEGRVAVAITFTEISPQDEAILNEYLEEKQKQEPQD